MTTTDLATTAHIIANGIVIALAVTAAIVLWYVVRAFIRLMRRWT